MSFFSAYAFGVGMVALINPCGFALLPAYLGFFLGQKDEEPNRIRSLNRAQGVGFALTLGIMVVFAAVGIVLGGIQSWFGDLLPYFNVALGVVLILLGIAMLFGFELKINIPKLQKGGKSGSFTSMFLFGMSYAIASLSCTLGLFLAAIGTSSSRGFTTQLGGFVSYGLGMGLLATVLTLLLALGKREIVSKFRSLLPKINLISAVLLLLVGPYMIMYGLWELQVEELLANGTPISPWLDSIISRGEGIQVAMTEWFGQPVSLFGREMDRSAWFGRPFVIINAMLIVAGFVSRRSNKSGAVVEADVADAEVTA